MHKSYPFMAHVSLNIHSMLASNQCNKNSLSQAPFMLKSIPTNELLFLLLFLSSHLEFLFHSTQIHVYQLPPNWIQDHLFHKPSSVKSTWSWSLQGLCTLSELMNSVLCIYSYECDAFIGFMSFPICMFPPQLGDNF